MYLDFILGLTRTPNQTGLNLSPRKKSIKGDDGNIIYIFPQLISL